MDLNCPQALLLTQLGNNVALSRGRKALIASPSNKGRSQSGVDGKGEAKGESNSLASTKTFAASTVFRRTLFAVRSESFTYLYSLHRQTVT
jgi:hypothetical protein